MLPLIVLHQVSSMTASGQWALRLYQQAQAHQPTSLIPRHFTDFHSRQIKSSRLQILFPEGSLPCTAGVENTLQSPGQHLSQRCTLYFFSVALIFRSVEFFPGFGSQPY